MKLHTQYFLYALAAFALWCSCTRPSLVGSGLLDDDIADLGFTDTFSLRIRAVPEDSVLMYTPNNGTLVARALCGHIEDPIFGTSDAEIYSEIFLSANGKVILENDIDSVVLSLVYDTTGLYGTLGDPLSIEVWRVVEEMSLEQTYYSDATFPVGPEPIGKLEGFVPRPYDTLTLSRPGDTSLIKPSLRIPLTEEFVMDMLNQDTITFQSQDSFDNWWPGFRINLTEGNNTMLAFNLTDQQSRVTVYYSKDENAGEISFIFSGLLGNQVHVGHFEHDYAGSMVEPFINNTAMGDSLAFVQGMSGLNTQIEIPALDDFDNVLINQAELELYMAEIPDNDTTIYRVLPQLSARVLASDGQLVIARDVAQALSIQQLFVFGGEATQVGDQDPKLRYTLNLTATIQDILGGKIENRIFISSFIKENQPERLILNGSGHPEYPARLRVTYTKVR